MAEKERVMERITGWPAGEPTVERLESERPIRLFVSHAKADQNLASDLIELIRESVDIVRQEIRCTSVPGYGLGIARHIPTALLEELEDSTIVLAVVTRSSLQSGWVMMELGAAWSKKKLWIVLDSDVGIEELPPPLREYHLLRLSDKSDLVQLTDAIAMRLGRRKRGGEYAADIFLGRRQATGRDIPADNAGFSSM